MFNLLNLFCSMWVLVFFDLPTETKKERKLAAKFRTDIIKDGFKMFQFSFYIRHCRTQENADTHISRVKRKLPKRGNVSIMCLTDKQFSTIEMCINRNKIEAPEVTPQLELF